MIEKDDLVPVGKFRRTHALKGELNASVDIDPEFFLEENPALVDIDGIIVPFYIVSVRPKGHETFLVRLDGVESEKDALQFVNKIIYASRSELSEFIGEEFRIADDMSGFRIVDEELGELGILDRLDDSTENALFVVESTDGDEILIPVVDAFILSVDDEERIIRTSLPPGLVDINNPSSDAALEDDES